MHTPSRSKQKSRSKVAGRIVEKEAGATESASAPGKRSESQQSPGLESRPWWAEAFVAGIVLFFGLIRVRLLHVPLERDEGEYAYAGQLILHGIVPYRYCYTMKLPGTAAAYAVFTGLFGQTAAGVHLGLLVVNSATIVLLFILTRRLFGKLAGVVAAAAFAFLSLEPNLLGFAGHATQFIVLPAVGGSLLLLQALESERLSLFFWSGLVLGIAFMMKQPALFFVLFGACYLAWREWQRGFQMRQFLIREGLLLLGAAVPFIATCLIVLRSGTFSKFWFWAFIYASKYEGIVPLRQGWDQFWVSSARVMDPAVLLWIIAGIGIIVTLLESKARSHAVFVLGFLAFSFAAVCPGLYFREHYFVQLLPAVALLCGVAVTRTMAIFRKSDDAPPVIPAILFVIALVMAVVNDAPFFFSLDPIAASRQAYPENPFPETQTIADYIRQHSAPEDRVAVLGSEPEIFFYSQRRSASGYVYTYPLMEPQPFARSMQQEMRAEIESAAPRFIVLVNVPLSWLARSDSDRSIFQWSEQYIRGKYRLVGAVDLLAEGSEFHWDADVQAYRPRSESRILVFQRAYE